MDAEDREIYANQVLGDRINAWWQSDVGQYVIGRSLQETSDLRSKLVHADPEDAKGIREIQTNIKIAEKSLLWLDEQVRLGEQASAQLEAQDDFTN